MARMTNTLSAWITRILGFDSSAQAYRDYQWVNLEMAARFHPRPSDPIWKLVTPPIAELVQQGFMKINLRCRLQQFQDTNKLPDEVIETISGVANEVGEANNLNPIFIILVTHQYVDADPWMRQLYKNAWVAAMVDRNNMAPPPESYLKYINTTYFAN